MTARVLKSFPRAKAGLVRACLERGLPRWQVSGPGLTKPRQKRGFALCAQHGHIRGSRPTLHLDGGVYHENTVPFSACFVPFQGRDVLVHRTAWNRLDAADPATGKSLMMDLDER